jgi:signal transduction histidine kinase
MGSVMKTPPPTSPEEEMSDHREHVLPVLRQQVTRATILRVLVIGFSLVIFLLLAAGFFGVRNIESIRESASKLEEGQALTTRLSYEIEDEQAALSAVFYKLSRDPETIDRDAILSDLDETDQHLARILTEISGTPEEPLWRELKRSSAAFTEEARRLLGLEDATTLLSRDLFHRHDQVNAIVAKLIEASNQKALENQNQIRLRSRQLLASSSVLLGACLILALVCAIYTVRNTTELFRRMEFQASELSRVSWYLLENQEITARRFSHELHDELGQALTAVKANLAALESRPDKKRLDDCQGLVDEAIRNVRELSQLLRPTILDDFGLDAGLRWLSDGFAQRTGIQVDYKSSLKERLPDETETHLFRIAQEALTNAARHSRASQVQMRLEPSGDRVLLSIRDNGRGLGGGLTSGADGGMGLIGMRARARSAGGEMNLFSANGNGLAIEVRVPLQERKHEEKNPHFVGG